MNEIEKVKKRFRDAYTTYWKILDGFDCGQHLAVYISSRASDALQEMIDAAVELTVLDPECPKSVFDRIEEWRKIMGNAMEEREKASRELNGTKK